MQVGLGYLHLNQSLSTLSGGELQRVKLASYLDSKGKIYVLKAADYVIELGPGGGQMAGKLLFAGTPLKMLSAPLSITSAYLKAELPY